jgi:hypothetical protein
MGFFLVGFGFFFALDFRGVAERFSPGAWETLLGTSSGAGFVNGP